MVNSFSVTDEARGKSGETSHQNILSETGELGTKIMMTTQSGSLKSYGLARMNVFEDSKRPTPMTNWTLRYSNFVQRYVFINRDRSSCSRNIEMEVQSHVVIDLGRQC